MNDSDVADLFLSPQERARRARQVMSERTRIEAQVLRDLAVVLEQNAETADDASPSDAMGRAIGRMAAEMCRETAKQLRAKGAMSLQSVAKGVRAASATSTQDGGE